MPPSGRRVVSDGELVKNLLILILKVKESLPQPSDRFINLLKGFPRDESKPQVLMDINRHTLRKVEPHAFKNHFLFHMIHAMRKRNRRKQIAKINEALMGLASGRKSVLKMYPWRDTSVPSGMCTLTIDP